MTVETEQDKNGKWQLKDRFAKFAVGEIGYDTSRKINRLRIINTKNGSSVYEYGIKNQSNQPKQTKKQESKETKAEQKAENKQIAPMATTASTVPNPNAPSWEGIFKGFIERHKIEKQQFIDMRARAYSDGKLTNVKPFKAMTPDEWVELINAMEALYEIGYFKDVA